MDRNTKDSSLSSLSRNFLDELVIQEFAQCHSKQVNNGPQGAKVEELMSSFDNPMVVNFWALCMAASLFAINKIAKFWTQNSGQSEKKVQLYRGQSSCCGHA